ncbi:fumarylacetoacetate hydrolase family protein [Litchfieldia alkalitelluris]|uniref:fumarylacetoacetate hydrolase family protein n=1 Tax=Litchfieldia alkalitelluris TaxID=304268 RepID=UPI00099747BF|nr:fumarylacetoacetate hydrolase family protein [Litchfieldia alkalitelluris]
MKLVTYEVNGIKEVGVIKDQSVVSLNKLLKNENFTMMNLVEKGLGFIKEIETQVEEATPDYDLESVSLKAPLERPKKVVCVGNNYMDHCREQNVEPPKNPLIFSKWSSCVVGYNDEIILPEESQQVDYEAELGVIIGYEGKHIPNSQALNYIFGYVAVNDISARDVQFSDGQWVRGKSYDTFIPMGPYILTADEVENPQNLAIKTIVNGKVLQDSNSKEMIFDTAYIISYLSKGITFEPGDLIATGTPHGVGVFRNPQVFLEDGDEVIVEVEGLGALKNPCVRSKKLIVS